MDSYGGEIGGNILSHNPYIYALNNPTVNIDNDGKVALSLVAGAAVVIGLAAGYYALREVTKSAVAVAANVLDNIINSSPISTYKPKEATKATTKDDTKVQVKPILPHTAPVEQNKPCTTATFTADMTDILRGERLTIDESVNYIKTGGNVMCDSQQAAFAVVNNFPNFIGPEIDKNQKFGFTYYPHYHPDRYSHRHIWFYPTTN